jgi:hypothetical protein
VEALEKVLVTVSIEYGLISFPSGHYALFARLISVTNMLHPFSTKIGYIIVSWESLSPSKENFCDSLFVECSCSCCCLINPWYQFLPAIAFLKGCRILFYTVNSEAKCCNSSGFRLNNLFFMNNASQFYLHVLGS